MHNNTEISNSTDADLQPIHILLAESDPSEIARIRSNIDREFQAGIEIAKNYDDLLGKITQPQLLILGRIDKSNYFQICQECHKIWESLPIVLISRQKVIDDSFRQLAKAWGVADIITNDPVTLDRLFQTLGKPRLQPPTKEPLPKPTLQPPTNEPQIQQTITGQMMLTGLREIATISNNFFGPLAQGNYWRKSHDLIVDEFPFILNWSADHFGKISCNESILEQELTDEDIESLRIWVRIFIEECERIIVGFGGILNNSGISAAAKDLLSKS
jgi:hypothetical protein